MKRKEFIKIVTKAHDNLISQTKIKAEINEFNAVLYDSVKKVSLDFYLQSLASPGAIAEDETNGFSFNTQYQKLINYLNNKIVTTLSHHDYNQNDPNYPEILNINFERFSHYRGMIAQIAEDILEQTKTTKDNLERIYLVDALAILVKHSLESKYNILHEKLSVEMMDYISDFYTKNNTININRQLSKITKDLARTMSNDETNLVYEGNSTKNLIINIIALLDIHIKKRFINISTLEHQTQKDIYILKLMMSIDETTKNDLCFATKKGFSNVSMEIFDYLKSELSEKNRFSFNSFNNLMNIKVLEQTNEIKFSFNKYYTSMYSCMLEHDLEYFWTRFSNLIKEEKVLKKSYGELCEIKVNNKKKVEPLFIVKFNKELSKETLRSIAIEIKEAICTNMTKMNYKDSVKDMGSKYEMFIKKIKEDNLNLLDENILSEIYKSCRSSVLIIELQNNSTKEKRRKI